MKNRWRQSTISFYTANGQINYADVHSQEEDRVDKTRENHRSSEMMEYGGNAGKKTRDEGLSRHAFGGQFGIKGIRDVLKEKTTIIRR